MAGRDSGRGLPTRNPDHDERGGELVAEEPGDPFVELQDAIETSRQQITDSLLIIRDEVDRHTDWRGWVREHPWQALGAAAFVGFLLGARPYL